MPSRWLEAYSELKSFIDANPRIEITPNTTSIPQDVRPEFYRLFDNVRSVFVNDNHKDEIDTAVPLSEGYNGASCKAINILGLSDVKAKGSLAWFLKNPVEGLNRLLYDLLFDLLKGKLDTDDFEYQALERVNRAFPDLFRLGYEHWVLLSLVNLFAPEGAFTVPLSGSEDDCTLDGGGEPAPGVIEVQVSKPVEARLLSLEHPRDAAVVTPDIIVRSTKTRDYISIRRELFAPQRTVKNISRSREWIEYRNIGDRYQYEPANDWPDMMVYADARPDNLALVADFARFCRPDVIIECMEQESWFNSLEAERIKRNHDFFKPVFGSFIISRCPVSDEVLQAFMPEPSIEEPSVEEGLGTGATEGEAPIVPSGQAPETETPAPAAGKTEVAVSEKEPGINVLVAGYDNNNLTPVLEALIGSAQTISSKKEV